MMSAVHVCYFSGLKSRGGARGFTRGCGCGCGCGRLRAAVGSSIGYSARLVAGRWLAGRAAAGSWLSLSKFSGLVLRTLACGRVPLLPGHRPSALVSGRFLLLKGDRRSGRPGRLRCWLRRRRFRRRCLRRRRLRGTCLHSCIHSCLRRRFRSCCLRAGPRGARCCVRNASCFRRRYRRIRRGSELSVSLPGAFFGDASGRRCLLGLASAFLL